MTHNDRDHSPRFRALTHGLASWRTLLLLGLVAMLCFTRMWDLGNRAYSHDESTHAWEAWKLFSGQGYRHDPVYHGPFLYHLTALMYYLAGVTDATARLGAALFAVATVLLVWPMRRWLGRAGAVASIALLTLSPTMMFRGRFIRHDVFVMLPSMLVILATFRYQEDRRERWLYLVAVGLGLAFCGKAVGFIYGFIIGSFWVLRLGLEWWRTRRPLRELPSFDLVVLLGTLALPLLSHIPLKLLGASPFEYGPGLFRELPPGPVWLKARLVILAMVAIAAAVGLWWKRRSWPICGALFYGPFLLLHTTLLTNSRGVESGLLGQLGYWLSQQPEARGGQPWYYFYFLMAVYEFLPALLALLGAGLLLLGRDGKENAVASRRGASDVEPTMSAFLPFLLYWTALMFAAWTWASEKMPWQAMHLVLPLGILGGWFLGRLWVRTDWRSLLERGALQALGLLPVAAFSLWKLVGITLGSPRPFSGMDLERLRLTLGWVVALTVLVIAVGLIWRSARRLGSAGWWHVVLGSTLLVLTLCTVRVAWRLSFINQDYATEFLVFAASTPDTAMVMRELDELSLRLGQDQPLRIAYDNESQQPFFWYLRDRDNVTFFTGDTGLSGEPHVVLVGTGNEAKLKSQLAGLYTRREYRLIWWPDESVYRNLSLSKLWQDLRDPARRRYWWDILWYRKYPQSTTAWPLVSKFAMYVHRDINQSVWLLGSGETAEPIARPEDEYDQKRVELGALAAWGSYGSAPGQFNYPKGIAVGPDGQLYIADSYNHRVQVLTTGGDFVRQWGSQGSAAGQFQEPWGIAVDVEGNVYVADTWNHRIQKFDTDGRFLLQWGYFGDTAGTLGDPNQLYGPRDIVVEPDGNLLVSDTGNERILRFTPGGEFLQQAGGAGALDGQFREPVGLAVDGQGRVYVADTWNQRIQQFDAQLRFLSEWAVLGWEGEGVTNKPCLAVDNEGSVYASAPDFHWLLRFASSGELEQVWGKYGADSTSFNMPTGVALDDAGNAYVVDSANHRVLTFAPLP